MMSVDNRIALDVIGIYFFVKLMIMIFS